MASAFFIPSEVVRDIYDWIRTAELAAISDFPQTSADEDTLVESFGTRLRCKKRVTVVSFNQEIPGPWKWSMGFTRFSGRGVEEKHIGSDAIVEMLVRRPNRFEIRSKSLLLQAKKNWTKDAMILEQAAKLSNWREAAAVINLTSRRFEAFELDSVIAAKGRRPSRGGLRLSNFLAHEFVGGVVGDDTISFDARRRILQWLDMKDTLVACHFRLKHRLGIEIEPPPGPHPNNNAAQIDPDEIHDHRLKAGPTDVLSVPSLPSASQLTKALRELQKIYHPDYYNDAAVFVREAVHRRSQEINDAVAVLRSKPLYRRP
jgi:hypothetical protein